MATTETKTPGTNEEISGKTPRELIHYYLQNPDQSVTDAAIREARITEAPTDAPALNTAKIDGEQSDRESVISPIRAPFPGVS